MKKTFWTLSVVSLFLVNITAHADDKAEITKQKLNIVKISSLEKKAQREKELLDRENARLALELETLKSKIPDLEDHLKSLDGEVKAGREENTRSRNNLEDLKKQKSEVQLKINKFTKERDELKESYTKSVASVKVEEKQLKEKISVLDKQESTTKDEQARLEKETEKLKIELKAIQAQSEAKENSLLKAQNNLNTTKSLLSDLKNKKETFLKNIATAELAKKKYNEDTQEAVKEISKTKTEISNLKIRVDVANQNHNDANNTYKTTAKEAAQLSELNKAEVAKLKKIEDEVIDLQEMIKAGRIEVEKAKKENEQLLKRSRQVLFIKPKLDAQLAVLKNQYKDLTEKNKALQNKVNN